MRRKITVMLFGIKNGSPKTLLNKALLLCLLTAFLQNLETSVYSRVFLDNLLFGTKIITKDLLLFYS